MSKELFSSEEVVAALERGGFYFARKHGGSHAAYARIRPDGGHDLIIVILGKKEIPKGTLKKALANGNVNMDEFLEWAKVKDKGR